MGLTVILGLLSALSWGLPEVPLARAARSAGVLPTVIGAVAIGLAVTSPILLFAGGLPTITAHGALLIVAMGVLTLAGYMVAFSAFMNGKVSVVAPTVACEGAVAAVFAILLGESIDTRVLLLLPFAAGGVVLASMAGDEDGGSGSSGALRAGIAAIIWGGVLVLAAPVADEVGVIWGFVLVRVVALVLALPLGLRYRSFGRIRPEWRNIAYWGVGDSAASLLYVAAADRGPTAVASVLAAQFGTVGVIAAMVILKERLRVRQWVGVITVIVAITLIAGLGGG
jgi:drug/metabolite transporter (DMT)-like permease